MNTVPSGIQQPSLLNLQQGFMLDAKLLECLQFSFFFKLQLVLQDGSEHNPYSVLLIIVKVSNLRNKQDRNRLPAG